MLDRRDQGAHLLAGFGGFPPTKIMRLKKMPETADRRLVGHRLAAKINTHKPPHRERIIERSDCHMVDMLMAALLKSV